MIADRDEKVKNLLSLVSPDSSLINRRTYILRGSCMRMKVRSLFEFGKSKN